LFVKPVPSQASIVRRAELGSIALVWLDMVDDLRCRHTANCLAVQDRVDDAA
jgi:hypothetical protein